MKLVTRENGNLSTTSKVVADVFGKTHRDVLRAIKLIDCSNEFSARNFAQSDYKTARGKVYQCYNITRDGFAFLCMGFTGKKAAEWKEKYITAFNDMESGLLSIDKRMTDLSIEKDGLKNAGLKWSELGRDIRARKDILMIKSNQLLNDVQLQLDY